MERNQRNQKDARPSGLRVLYLAPRECWPPDTGAKLRNYYLARELARYTHLTFLSFTDQPNSDEQTRTSDLPRPETLFEETIAVPRERGYTPAKLVRGLVGSKPLPVLNYFTQEMTQKLIRVLDQQDFDIVQVESVQLTAYLPMIRAARSRPLVACDWHNVDSELMQRYSEYAPTLARRFYARLTASRLVALERDAMNSLDAHFTVSERDRNKLLKYSPDAPVSVIENGVDVEYLSGERIVEAYRNWPGQTGNPEAHRLIFVGSMDYHANVDAVVHFAREVWPALREKLGAVSFTIVGRDPTDEVRKLGELPGIEVTGTVDDVRPYYHDALAQVVPLRVGGGSRLKILESMAAGVPVISTTLGAEGIEISNQENILIADDNETLVQACVELSANSVRRKQIAEGGLALARSRYDWSAIGRRLLETYKDLLP